MKGNLTKGYPARIDEAAESGEPELPAFLAFPERACAYHGFPLLGGYEKEGFTFGVITEPVGAKRQCLRRFPITLRELGKTLQEHRIGLRRDYSAESC